MHLLPSTSCVTQVAGHSDYFRKHLVLGAFAGGEGVRQTGNKHYYLSRTWK